MTYYFIFNYFKTYSIDEVAILLGVTPKQMQKLVDTGMFKFIRITEDIIRITPWSLEIGAAGLHVESREAMANFLDDFFYNAHWRYDLEELCHILGITKEVASSLLHSGIIPHVEKNSTISIHPYDLYNYLRYFEEFNPRRAWYEQPEDESKYYEFYYDDYRRNKDEPYFPEDEDDYEEEDDDDDDYEDEDAVKDITVELA